METALYAKEDCGLCHGRGIVKTGKRLGEEAICLCVLINKRKADADRVVATALPKLASRMRLDGYQTGGDPKNEQALVAARNFVDSYEEASRDGWVLGFHGPPGCGKTFLTVAIAVECVYRYLASPVIFNVSTELRRERERFRETEQTDSPIDRAINADLLVLDDLGAEYHRQGSQATEVSWVYEQLYTVLEGRIMECRPTLFSSNLAPGELASRMGNEAGRRVLSRISRAQVSSALEIVPVEGANTQSAEAAARLFAPRTPKCFELRNRLSGRRKRYDWEGLAGAVNGFRDAHGDDAVLDQLVAHRVERDGEPVREEVSLEEVFSGAGVGTAEGDLAHAAA
jgi:DNA replication protein DnaC